jgi:hypothetical protein
MLLDIENLFSLFILLFISTILIISFIYCFTCKPTFVNPRQQLIHWQIIRAEESAANQADSENTIAVDQQISNGIRNIN